MSDNVVHPKAKELRTELERIGRFIDGYRLVVKRVYGYLNGCEVYFDDNRGSEVLEYLNTYEELSTWFVYVDTYGYHSEGGYCSGYVKFEPEVSVYVPGTPDKASLWNMRAREHDAKFRTWTPESELKDALMKFKRHILSNAEERKQKLLQELARPRKESEARKLAERERHRIDDTYTGLEI